MHYLELLLPGLASFQLGLIAGVVLTALLMTLLFVSRTRRDRQTIDYLEQQLGAARIELTAATTHLDARQRDSENTARQLAEQLHRYDALSERFQSLREDNAGIKAQLESQKQGNAEQQRWIDERMAQMKNEFEALSTRILDEKSKKFTEQNSVSIKALIEPVGEKIAEFEKRVNEAHSKEVELHGKLGQQIREVVEANEKIRLDAENLTKALSGNVKSQGNWGEVVLEKVLEKSGLRAGEEYQREKSYTDDGRRLRPDVIINLPGERKVIVDSKVSLAAWNRLINIEASGDDESRNAEMASHVTSLNHHIKELASREYQDIVAIESLEFVLMFVPIEAAFLEAVKADPKLFDRAFESRVIVVTPSTLLACLKTIEHLWRLERQTEGAKAVVIDAKKLHSKFVNFASDLERLGGQLDTVNKTYEEARKKLATGRGNILGIVNRLQDRGMASDKTVPASLTALSDGSDDARDMGDTGDMGDTRNATDTNDEGGREKRDDIAAE